MRGTRKLMLLLTIIISLSFPLTVFANREEVDSVTYIAKNQAEVSSICSRANSVVGKNILVYTGSDGLLSFSNKLYSELDLDGRNEFMETALLITKESGLGSQIKNKVYNFIADQDSTASAAIKYLRSDTSADFSKAVGWLRPFSGVFGTLLGVICIFIFLVLGLSCALDIAYMFLPMFKATVQKGRDTRPLFISREAYSVMLEAEDGVAKGEWVGYMSLYMQRRIPAIIGLAICLGYLISGQIYDLMGWFIDSFSWVLENIIRG